MKLSYLFSGNAPTLHKFQIGATSATVAGAPFLVPTLSDTDGVLACTATSAADQLGVSVDIPGSRQTAQQSDNSDPARYVTLIINPGAVYDIRLCGGATSGTALSLLTNTVASTSGLLTTLAASTVYDDGYIWGYDGANAGVLRKVIAVGGTNETPIIAFPADIAVGDRFIACTFGPGEKAGIQLTSLLDEANATGDIQSTDNFRCIRMKQADLAGDGTTKSRAEIILVDHVYSGNIT